jgi:orotidine-5'-phosphate decarboxylase
MDDHGGGFLINVSRSVLYASKGDDYAKAARKEAQKLRGRINLMREAAQARPHGPPGR